MKEMVPENGMNQAFLFKDLSPLTEDFIPKRIQFREKQISTINYYLSGLIRYGVLMNNIVVYGHPGTGKTHSVKYVLSTIKPKANVFYGMAYRSTSAHSFFRRFLENNFQLTLHPRESISVYYSAFEKVIERMKNVLLIFDDIQYIVTGDPKGLDGLLFYLSRLKKNLGLIIIGNIKLNDLQLVLESPTTSSLKLRSIYFPKYNATELTNIIKDRAQDALTENAFSQSTGAIAKIAALTAQSWGSARYALDLFKEAGMVSEVKFRKGYITEHAVDEAHKMIEESNIEDQFRELPLQALSLLEAIYRLREKKDISTGDVYASYEAVCRDVGIESFTLRKVSDIITELESTGLISCRLISRGRFGRTRLIYWPSNPILDKIYERERRERF